MPPPPAPAVFSHLPEETYTGTVDCGRGTIQSSAAAAGLPTGTAPYTVLLEFKCSSNSGSEALYAWGSASVHSMNALLIRASYLRHYWWGNDLDWDLGSSGKTIDNICDGAWHTTGTQFDGTTRRIFFDGATVVSDTPSGTHADLPGSFCLGAELAGVRHAFTGSIRLFEVFASGSVAATTISPPAPPPQPPPRLLFSHLPEEVYTGTPDCDRGTIQSDATAAGLPIDGEPVTVYFEYKCSGAYIDLDILYQWGHSPMHMLRRYDKGFQWGNVGTWALDWRSASAGVSDQAGICDDAYHSFLVQTDGLTYAATKFFVDGAEKSWTYVDGCSSSDFAGTCNLPSASTGFCLGGSTSVYSTYAARGTFRNFKVRAMCARMLS